MYSKQVKARPQIPALPLALTNVCFPQQPVRVPSSSGTPQEHQKWALDRKANKEHVSFPAFVIRFGFYDRTDAHRAYGNLLDCGKINEQRLKRVRSDYEHFKSNKDDLFWSRRLENKSTEIVVRNASVQVQEAGLEQVKSNFQRHLNMHEPKKPEADGRHRGGATATEFSEGDMENTTREKGTTFVEHDILDGAVGPEATEDADGLADTEGFTEEEGFQDAGPLLDAEGDVGDEMAQFGSNTTEDSEGRAKNGEIIDDKEELQEIEEAITSGQSPFLPLLEYVYKKVQGQGTELPPVPSNFICQEYKELYQYAHNNLMYREQDRDRDKNKGKDKSRAYHVDKEVLVALSGIVNTISPSTRTFSFTSAIKADSLVAALDEKDVALAELMNELLEAYCPGHEEDPFAPLNFRSLRIKVWSQLAELGATPPATRNMRQRVAVLQVVDHICTLISTNHLALPTTEHVIVSVWSFVLAVMLGGQVVRGIPGELASPAAKDVRLHVESKYGVTTKSMRGRKVDISVRVFANNHWNNEICVFEFKPGTASDVICTGQQLKAVRLNTSVLHDLEFKGVDTSKNYPIVAEGRGLCLSFYTLKRNGNVITAGRSTNGVVWIPSDVVQLKQFLKSESMQILLNFSDHTSRYAVRVQETLSSSPLPPLPSTPPPRYKKPFAAFTPSKHNKRKRTEKADEDHDVVEDQDEEEDTE
ncbi:hypothetical protein BG011_008422 [Mortierella polycephala]|uniref:Uncharacterized protein n=1 Tax=Mortierella polycephala TaxID=41804 RepID=A0A9P6PQ32_9FUNG|nr:hypothetical protein BG011_008422 [Mortierella polycephala]